MYLNEYQSQASRTLNEKVSIILNTSNLSMGLCGEAGEVVDYLKKVYFHGHELDNVKLKHELGDVLWYISGIATVHKIDLRDIAVSNIEKLKKRYPDGFDQNKSKNREE